MLSFKGCDKNNTGKGLESNKHNHSYQILNAEEIVNTVAEVEPPDDN